MDSGGVRLDALARAAEQRAAALLPHAELPEPDGAMPGRGSLRAAPRTVPQASRAHHRGSVRRRSSYRGAPRRPLKAIDREDQVVLLGSFSKILFPGLRLGWLVLPRPLLSAMRELRQVADFSSGLFVQHAMLRFCRRGRLDRHVEEVRRIYGRRLETMLGAMKRHFPPGVSWTEPEGGLTVWITLPEEADSLELLQSARAEGVDFSPGFLFFPNGGGAQHIRLSYVRETEERIERGIEILGRLLRAHCAERAELVPSRPFF
ncbi:MAG: PLP-dependent aminotransferase family protein [Candidatus Eisenbacteria bacterium]